MSYHMITDYQLFYDMISESRIKGSDVDSESIKKMTKIEKSLDDLDDDLDDPSRSRLIKSAKRLIDVDEDMSDLKQIMTVSSDDPEIQEAILKRFQMLVLQKEDIRQELLEKLSNERGSKIDKIISSISDPGLEVSDLKGLPNFEQIDPDEFQGDLHKSEDHLSRDSRKIRASLRKLSHAEAKIRKAVSHYKRGNYNQSAEMLKDAERKLSKVLDKKLETNMSMGGIQQVIISRIEELTPVIKEIEDSLKDQDLSRVDRMLDKRDVSDKIDREKQQTYDETQHGSNKLDKKRHNEIQPSEEEEDDINTQVSGSTTSKSKKKPRWNISRSNVEKIFDPELHQGNKTVISKERAKKLANLLYRATLGDKVQKSDISTRAHSLFTSLGTDEETINKILVDVMPADPYSYSLLADIYFKIELKKNWNVSGLINQFTSGVLGSDNQQHLLVMLEEELTSNEYWELMDRIIEKFAG